jgi:hypothetical protein
MKVGFKKINQSSLGRSGFYFALGVCTVLGVFIFSLYSFAAWSNPSANPPNNNIAEPINAGNYTQAKLGSFKIGTTTAPASVANLFVFNGQVAIATSTLGARLTIDDPLGSNVSVVNVGGNRIVGLSLTPLANDEAASRYYVDNRVAASNFWADRGSNNISNTNTGNIGIGTNAPGGKLNIDNGDLIFTKGSSFGTWRYGSKVSVLSGLKGRQINNNPDFLEGLSSYSIYDNGGSGSITITLVSDDTVPNSSGRIMQIDHSAVGTPIPGWGGFFKAFSRCAGTAVGQCYREGDRIVYKIWAKIPVGYNINFNSNAYGTGGGYYWLSSQAGTGLWEEYIAVQQIGSGGSFASTAYFYLSGGVRPLTWYVAAVDIIDIDQVADVDRASELNVGYKKDVVLGAGSLLSTNATYLATDAGNVGIGTTTVSQKLQVNGNILGNNIYAPSIENFKQIGSLVNKVITPDTTQIAQSPISGFLWHDLIAFNKNATPTFETSVDGSTWVAGVLDKKLFSHIENQAITIIDPTTTKAVRWTWSSGISCSFPSWLVLGVTWWSTSPNVTVLAETSADGSTWTTVHNSAGTYNSAPVWFYLSGMSNCNAYFRVTITSNNAGLFRLSSMRLLTTRWGDQGLGSENSFPYVWDANRNIAFGASAVANGVVTIGSNTTVATGGLYFGTDSNLYRSGANQLKTDNSLVVAGNVGIATSSSASYRLDVNGLVRVNGDIKVSGTITAGPGDLAEEFFTDRNYPAGTVLVMGEQGYKSAQACAKKYDSNVIGVISETPGLVIGKVEGKYKAQIALAGVIKVLVNNSGGLIHKGDLLTTSAIRGEAMRADEPKLGTVIGKALEDSNGKGYVMALINLK